MANTLTVAVGQNPAALDGPQARLAWLADALDRLRGRRPDLLVLPELFLTGYNIGDRVRDRAEAADGPSARAVADLARRHRVAILYGFAEKHGEALFNSATCIGKDGARLSTHRKLLLPPGFEGDHFAPGDRYTLFELGGVRVATLICYDVEFPETVRQVAEAGAELVVAPTALGAQWGVVANQLIPTRAFESGVYLCYANSCGQENGMDYFGGSCIVAPNGDCLARAGAGEELLCAEIDQGAVQAAQSRLPYLVDRKKLPV